MDLLQSAMVEQARDEAQWWRGQQQDHRQMVMQAMNSGKENIQPVQQHHDNVPHHELSKLLTTLRIKPAHLLMLTPWEVRHPAHLLVLTKPDLESFGLPVVVVRKLLHWAGSENKIACDVL